MEGVKIYGLCLERLRHQINIARQRVEREPGRHHERFLLECYNTGELEEIIDILELYDVQERTAEEIREKLDDLAYTVTELLREPILFDYTDEGYLGLYLALLKESPAEVAEDVAVAA